MANLTTLDPNEMEFNPPQSKNVPESIASDNAGNEIFIGLAPDAAGIAQYRSVKFYFD